jgi:hypothetical protein
MDRGTCFILMFQPDRIKGRNRKRFISPYNVVFALSRTPAGLATNRLPAMYGHHRLLISVKIPLARIPFMRKEAQLILNF